MNARATPHVLPCELERRWELAAPFNAGFDYHLVKPPDLDAPLRLLGIVPPAGREVVTRTLQ